MLDKTGEMINNLLINSFNKIITLEKCSLEQSPLSDLTIKEFHAIEAIGLHEKTMTEAAAQLGVTAGTFTVTISRLVQKGYVVRREIEGDRRYVKLGLTKKGKLAWRVHESFHRHMVMSMLEGLKEEEYQILIRSLQGLDRFLDEGERKCQEQKQRSGEKRS